MKILDVILKEQADKPIIQGTNWTKTWLDWDEIPDLVVKNNPAAYANVKPLADPAQAAKAKLDAWRRANPGKFPEEAWTYLGGKGPIPTPSKEMPARDLRTQPPDDSGTWIDSGNYWTHTIPPFIFAIKPDNRNKATWGPPGGNTSYVPVEEKIKGFRKENPKITDQEIEAKLRALAGTGTVGGKMYSNREIATGIEKARTTFAFNKKEKEAEEEDKEVEKKAKEQQDADKQFKKNKTCPIGFQVNDDEDGCKRVPNNPPEGEQPPAPVANTDKPPEPVFDVKSNTFTCKAPWVYDEKTKSCVKQAPAPAPAPAPEGNVSMIWPAGNKKLLTDKFGARNGNHRGIDIQLPYGSDVVAPEDGTIFERATQVGLAGLYIKLRSNDGLRVHTFMHLSITIKIPESGIAVTQGKRIAQSGGEKRSYARLDDKGKPLVDKDGKPVIVPEKEDTRAGQSTGAHLHWGLEVNGKYVDPLIYVDKK
jgi:murein DD-endopeptidase MepM/ murein hydrolase activator NlpD